MRMKEREKQRQIERRAKCIILMREQRLFCCGIFYLFSMCVTRFLIFVFCY